MNQPLPKITVEPCHVCGQQLTTTWSSDGLSSMSQPHYCKLTLPVIRQVIKEEIEAAIKRLREAETSES
jgi:hypothetical protein